MILFHELKIGTDASGGVRPCPRCLRSAFVTAAGQAATEPTRLQALTPHIEELATADSASVSVMLRGFEPFQHPDLVDIIHSLTAAKFRRIGMRTDGAALANPRDAQGCIDNGVRVFEIPFLPREMDALSKTAPLEASFAGIQGIRNASAALGVVTFICADIVVCAHTAKYFNSTVQAAIATGVDAIRLNCDGICDESRGEPKQAAELLGGTTVLNQAHSLATQNSVAFFGDGCESFLEGAKLYEVIAQQEKNND